MFSRPFADYSTVRRCKVDVPAVYDPNGPRGGIDTRPDLINSINTRIYTGRVFWLLRFWVYAAAPLLFPAKETFLTSRIPERNDLRKSRLRSRRSLGEKLRR